MAAKAPRGVPILGLLPRIRKDPLGLFLEAARCGDVVPIDIGFRPAFLVNHPDHIRRVLQDNRANYPKSVLYEKMRPAFGNGLLMSEGETWATQRRLIQPAFSHGRLEGMAALMASETRACLPRLAQASSSRTAAGRPIDMGAELSALTLSIVVKAMFGAELTDDLNRIGQAVEILNEHSNHRFHALIDPPIWFPTPRNLKARRALKHLESIVYRMIRERRAERKDGSAAESVAGRNPAATPKSDDLLGMLLAARYDDGSSMSEIQVRDEVMTIFLAGHETTATSLAWTLDLLDAHPEAEAKLRSELAALGDRDPGFADLPRLPYLRMVLEESMRLRPPVWSFSRTALGPDDLGGTAIPKGALLFVSPYVLHRDPRWWDDPEVFRPERFLPEAAEKRQRYAYFPFGGGPRMCIGNGFAMVEGQLVLAGLLRHYRFRMRPGGRPGLNPLVTLRPKGGMWMAPVPAEAMALTP